MDYSSMSPCEVRKLIKEQKITGQTSGMCAGYAQANLCILPKDLAFDFLLFCTRNPRPCPILEVGDAGSRLIKTMADNADVATDFPKYRVWKNGVLTEEKQTFQIFGRMILYISLSDALFHLKPSFLRQAYPYAILKRAKMCLCSTPILNFRKQAYSQATW